MSGHLYLHEEIMLLAFHDQEGTIVKAHGFPYAVGGAVLAELIMAERLEVGEGEEELVRVTDPTPLGDPLLDEWLETIRDREKPRSLAKWVAKVAGSGKLKHRIALGLCRRGILRTEEDKVLWIFTRKVYPEVDPGPEREIRERLEEAIFQDPDQVTPRTAALVALAYHSGVLEAVFDADRLEEREETIERIAAGELLGGATRDAVRCMQAAATVAVMIPAMTVTTSM